MPYYNFKIEVILNMSNKFNDYKEKKETMMEIKKTTKYDGKLKGVHIVDNNLIDAEGEIIDLISVLSKVYGENFFDLSTTCKEEEIIDVEPDEEATIGENGDIIYEG